MSLAVEIVGGKWKLNMMWVLDQGPRRFGEIRRLLEGISEKVLTEQLRQLEQDGIVSRTVYAEIPPRVEYELTELGWELAGALKPLEDWGDTVRERILRKQGAGERSGEGLDGGDRPVRDLEVGPAR
ncbi:winged helix-turn-helix transcriptional regulator [Salininema proteolyticum]|uniref:Winged helix-turn-helix transcriptional regulator n=1 Tax=Salininema proteolyticum TaxID=1607685 RepID=A0ABV8U322_9ACTN